ncbi:carbohydrate ABC transporter substrate-binding protein, CUT1 family [Thioclava sp. ES.031]|uniref:ABC transporter substrate-binding protein n=1 Tax=Thioclava sp. ES.031 TaxID=1798203 RepID=UPI000BF2510E|nr:extracellular solute-binding protein [Thioclava sp. ES.031]PFG65098.1 carbohydrate ABC transporter substrate-binding protein, CUT1 family [Thioclava sp. ES.031]
MKLWNVTAGAVIAATGFCNAAFATTDLTMWYHGAGNKVEGKIVNQIIDDFNKSQSDYKVALQSFPQNSYNDSVTAAALAGNLPDILDMDGPIMPNWAWSGYLQPLPIPEDHFKDFLPGTKGVYDGKLYSIGLWDAAVALYARKSTMKELGLRTPTLDKPWTKDEFMSALEAAKKSGKFDYAIDLGMSDKGEWYPYAFLPFLQSFGGGLVNRKTYDTAEGVLNGDAAIAWGNWWQSLFTDKLAPGTSQDPAAHETGFIDGKYAFSWNGNWNAVKTMDKVDDVEFLPAPDFGNGSKIGGASWQFGISASSKAPEGAAEFIKFATQDKYLAEFSDALGLIPATKSAAQMTKNYKTGGPLAVFYGLSEAQAEKRPVTPGYVVDSKVFQKAAADIADGADVIDTLDSATDQINADIKRNDGYKKN